MYSLKVVNIVKLEAILFMQIRWSKRQNSAWEPGKSNSAYPKYAKKSCSQLLLRNASRLTGLFSRNGSSLWMADYYPLSCKKHWPHHSWWQQFPGRTGGKTIKSNRHSLAIPLKLRKKQRGWSTEQNIKLILNKISTHVLVPYASAWNSQFVAHICFRFFVVRQANDELQHGLFARSMTSNLDKCILWYLFPKKDGSMLTFNAVAPDHTFTCHLRGCTIIVLFEISHILLYWRVVYLWLIKRPVLAYSQSCYILGPGSLNIQY